MFRSIFLCGLSLFMVATSSHANTDSNIDVCQQRRCMAVVDAGSMGSRVHIYAYDQDNQGNPIAINEAYTKKMTPGFATVEPKPENVYQYLDELFAGIPKNDLPVYFYATGGMRLIPNAQQQVLYQYLKQWFWSKPQLKLQEARTISGSEEAVLGWLGINYHLNTLKSGNQAPVGLIEIGGASVQLVFPIDNLTDLPRQNIVRVSAYGEQFLIYAQSFLSAGANEVAKKVSTLPECYPLEYALPNGQMAAGDAAMCEQSINQTINSENIIGNVAKIATKNNPPSKWYTVGVGEYLVQSSADFFQNGGFTPQTLLNYVDSTYCKQNWSVLQTIYPNDPFIEKNCLSGALFYGLTVDGFGLMPDQAVQTLNDGTNADWTLGVIVHQSPENAGG